MALVVIGVSAVSLGCSPVDVYPITGQPSAGGAGDAVGGSGGTAGASRGGAGTSAGSGGNAGSAGTSGGGTDGGEAGTGGSPSVTCPADVLKAGDTTHSVSVGGVTRTYVLHVPPGYDGTRPVPLVVDFHGVGSSGAEQRASSPYPARLDSEGVIMAFPDGMRGPAGTAWNLGPCCVADVDDVGFARALVDDVSARACIDRQRVYAVGVLTGGGLVHYLGCHAADVFAAIAPAAFDLLEENVGDCAPARPITVVAFRGNGESRVPYEGGYSALVPGMPITFLGARGAFEAWAEINGCIGAPSPEDAAGCTRYSTCNAGVEVVLCTKQGGSEDPGAPDIAWPVLARHTL